MELAKFKAVVEGLLFASGDEGMTKRHLASILEIDHPSVQLILDELKYDYEHEQRGITIMQAKDVFHLTTKPEHAPYFQKMVESPQSSRLSQAALETLAIIAYNQPITRMEVEEIRGVKSERPIQTLLNRLLIVETGRKDTSGRPILYGTSTDFLTFFGLTSIDELPPLPKEVNSDEWKQKQIYFLRNLKNKLINQMTPIHSYFYNDSSKVNNPKNKKMW